MADIVVRAPNGDLVEVPESDYQNALNSGYQNVEQAEADAARAEYLSSAGEQAAASEGLLTADDSAYDPATEALIKTTSAATFGLAAPSDPTSRLTGQRFQEEHPYAAMAAEVAGQLPLAIATGGVGEAAVAATAGRSLATRAGVRLADFGAQAAIGGAQTEAEAARLEGREFSATNAAVAGLVGEAFGRTAGLGFSTALGASRNLVASATQRAVERDTADALSRGGFLNDFRVAQHADQYQNELARLAADDLDALETNFAEVSRQDRKRARIARVVEDRPAEQAAVRAEALGAMQSLYESLYTEIGEGSAPGPARKLLDQLRERMDVLGEAPSGARLWRQLDENRQALQEYAQDLHQAYENAPGSAWLSREALNRLDVTERATREALLREDVWGAQAARDQAAYNVPFHTKYFPTAKTVRGKLMFSTATDARGFPVYRGDPGRVRSFFTRNADDVDSARLGEQFSEYLDGVEAIARAGERDTPAAARNTLEAVRRLRKAASHAEFIQHAAARTGRRADVAEVVIGGGVGFAAGGPAGAAFGGAAGQLSRGLRMTHWLGRAARKLGWAGDPQSMAKLLGRDALPRRYGPDAPTSYLDDLHVPGRGPSEPPSGGPGVPQPPPGTGGGPGMPPTPGAPPGVAGAGGQGLTPSMLADARRGSWAPSAPAGAGATTMPPAGDSLSPDEAFQVQGRLTREQRAARPTEHAGERQMAYPAAEGRLADGRGARQADARRVEALAEGEFRDVINQLRASGNDQAVEMAARLESSRAELVEEGLIDEADLPSPDGWGSADAGLRAPPGLDEVDEFYRRRAAERPADAAPADPWADLQRAAEEANAAGALRPMSQPTVDMDAFERGAARRPGRSAAEEDAAYNALRDQLGRRPTRDELRAARMTGAPEHVRAAVDTFREMGLDIRMGGDRLEETFDTVFGEGKAPTPEQWRRIIPLETLKALGPVERARIDVLGDAFIWTAEGVEGVAAPYREWDGVMNPGGTSDNAWKISRTFSRDDAGRLEVHHDHFFVRGDLQGTGVGAKVLRDMMAEYRKVGVDVVTVDSVEVGKYFWPSIGFNHPDPTTIRNAVRAYREYVQNTPGLPRDEVARALAEADKIRSLPALAQAEFGKDFLLNKSGPWNFGLRMNLGDENPMFHLMRGRLDIAAGALAVLGAGQLEKPPADDAEGGSETAAAGAPGIGGFAAAAALFNRSSARLVAGAAKRLFSVTAEPVAKATARLAYSRQQIEARRAELTAWHQNPEAPGGLIARLSEGLRDAPPEAFASASAASYRALAFLKSRMPQSGKGAPIAANSGVPVSAEAAMKYARYEQAALQPGDAIREASESGHLSQELLETLGELYPELLAELRVAAYQAVQDAGPRSLSIQAKTQYARLFDGRGELADPTFAAEATAVYAAAYEQVAATNPPKPPNPSGPHVTATAKALTAPQPWKTG